MKRLLLLALLLPLTLPASLSAQTKSQWRAATSAELAAALPARAPVVKERIETEMRTASGIIDTRGKLIAGVVLNTTFLVREIRRNEQHDAFINAVTHELKTPVASIRLYVETLQTRTVDETRRNEFYSIILADSDRKLGSIEQIRLTGPVGSSSRKPHLVPLTLTEVVMECVARARILHGGSGSGYLSEIVVNLPEPWVDTPVHGVREDYIRSHRIIPLAHADHGRISHCGWLPVRRSPGYDPLGNPCSPPLG